MADDRWQMTDDKSKTPLHRAWVAQGSGWPSTSSRNAARFLRMAGRSSRANWAWSAFEKGGLVHAVDDRGGLVLAEGDAAGGEDCLQPSTPSRPMPVMMIPTAAD